MEHCYNLEQESTVYNINFIYQIHILCTLCGADVFLIVQCNGLYGWGGGGGGLEPVISDSETMYDQGISQRVK